MSDYFWSGFDHFYCHVCWYRVRIFTLNTSSVVSDLFFKRKHQEVIIRRWWDDTQKDHHQINLCIDWQRLSVILWNYFTTSIYSNATARLKYCPLLQLCVTDSLSFLTESITEGSCFFKNLNEKHARSAWECNIQFYNVCAIYFCSLVVRDEKQTGFWRRCWTLRILY